MSDDMDEPAIVIDNGTDTIKAGFGQDEAPRSVFRTSFGRLKRFLDGGAKKNDFITGSRINEYVHDIIYPIEHGVVTNWDYMQKIWTNVFNTELHADPSEHPVIFTESLLNPRNKREEMVKIMFETFDVPLFYCTSQNVLSIYGSGRTTGLSCDIGDEMTTVVPVYEGYSIPCGIQNNNCGGRHLTEYLQKLLSQKEQSFMKHEGKQMAQNIKKEYSYVKLNQSESLEDIEYKITEKKIITINEERFKCPELLFDPSLNHIECNGIDFLILESIKKCNIDITQDMYQNIVLSGGSSLIKGLPEKIETKVHSGTKPITDVKCVPPKCEYSAWFGGSMLSTLETFPQMAITREEYDDTGSYIINHKCI